MLHVVISNHSPESCPGRAGNEQIIPYLNKMQELLSERGVNTVGKWAGPPGHQNYLVLEAPDAHAVLQVFMESGLSAHTSTEIRAVISLG